MYLLLGIILFPAEAAALENAAREMDAGEYVTDSAINWE